MNSRFNNRLQPYVFPALLLYSAYTSDCGMDWKTGVSQHLLKSVSQSQSTIAFTTEQK